MKQQTYELTRIFYIHGLGIITIISIYMFAKECTWELIIKETAIIKINDMATSDTVVSLETTWLYQLHWVLPQGQLLSTSTKDFVTA